MDIHYNTFKTYYDYYEVHQNALAFKNGNKDCGLMLINAFGEFLNYYSRLINYKEFDLNHKSTRAFIKMFMPNKKIAKNIHKFKRAKSINSFAYEGAKNINKMFSHYSEPEVNTELIIVLLLMAKRYSDTKPSFHLYVQKMFHYTLMETVRSKFKNVCVLDSTLSDNIDIQDTFDNYYVSNKNIDKYYFLKNSSKPKVKDYDCTDTRSLNNNWIQNITSTDIFKTLTAFEKMILIESYIYNKTDEEIATEYGTCRATINRRKMKAKNKLLDIGIKNNLLR